jgi:hypothetical protein
MTKKRRCRGKIVSSNQAHYQGLVSLAFTKYENAHHIRPAVSQALMVDTGEKYQDRSQSTEALSIGSNFREAPAGALLHPRIGLGDS